MCVCGVQDTVREHRYSQKRREIQPHLPSPYWLPGGAYMAVTSSHLPIRRYDHQQIALLKHHMDVALKRGLFLK
jgi:hypothetical protein